MSTKLFKAMSAFSILALFVACGRSEKMEFEDSLKYAFEANQISGKLPEMQQSLSSEEIKKQESLLYEYIEKSLQKSEAVSTKFLDKLHPEIAKLYRNHLMKGQKLYLEGLKGKNVLKQMQGIQLMNRWYDFMDIHAESIIEKVDSL